MYSNNERIPKEFSDYLSKEYKGILRVIFNNIIKYSEIFERGQA